MWLVLGGSDRQYGTRQNSMGVKTGLTHDGKESNRSGELGLKVHLSEHLGMLL